MTVRDNSTKCGAFPNDHALLTRQWGAANTSCGKPLSPKSCCGFGLITISVTLCGAELQGFILAHGEKRDSLHGIFALPELGGGAE